MTTDDDAIRRWVEEQLAGAPDPSEEMIQALSRLRFHEDPARDAFVAHWQGGTSRAWLEDWLARYEAVRSRPDAQ